MLDIVILDWNFFEFGWSFLKNIGFFVIRISLWVWIVIFLGLIKNEIL